LFYLFLSSAIEGWSLSKTNSNEKRLVKSSYYAAIAAMPDDIKQEQIKLNIETCNPASPLLARLEVSDTPRFPGARRYLDKYSDLRIFAMIM
jgi:hypothetical protein